MSVEREVREIDFSMESGRHDDFDALIEHMDTIVKALKQRKAQGFTLDSNPLHSLHRALRLNYSTVIRLVRTAEPKPKAKKSQQRSSAPETAALETSNAAAGTDSQPTPDSTQASTE